MLREDLAELDLEPGRRYDFHTTDGTCYADSILRRVDPDLGGVMIEWGRMPARVYISRHELARVEVPD